MRFKVNLEIEERMNYEIPNFQNLGYYFYSIWNLSHNSCPACGSEDPSMTVLEIGDRRWKDKIEVDVCGSCTHLFAILPTRNFKRNVVVKSGRIG